MGLVLEKSLNALASGGRLAFTVKQGDGIEWRENKDMLARYFQYWRKPELDALVQDAGFMRTDSWVERSDNPASNEMWIMVACGKS